MLLHGSFETSPNDLAIRARFTSSLSLLAQALSSWKTLWGFKGSVPCIAWFSRISHSARPRPRSAHATSGPPCAQVRDERSQNFLTVANDVDLHRVADAEHLAVYVDPPATHLAQLRQPLGIGETRADREQSVAFLHHLVAGLDAQEPYRLMTKGRSSGNASRPLSVLAIPQPRTSVISLTS